MMKSCIIVEDQPPAQRVLKKYISDLGSLDLKGVFADGIEALEFMKENEIDLIFLDVHLPKLSGIDFLKILSPKPAVILTTAFSDYAIEGYELNILDYLLKPFSFERFVKAVEKSFAKNKAANLVTEVVEKDSQRNVFIKSGSEYLNLHFDQIRYIKSDGDYTLVMMQESKHLIANPLRFWVQRLPPKYFCQVHKSYIVNVQFITKVIGSQIYLKDVQIPIGRTFKESFASKHLEQF